MKITKIELQNFRAFYGNYPIDLGKGKNLLVYGENGSGKSSLYHALREFLFGQNRPLQPQRNIFAADDSEAFIKLSVATQPNRSPEMLTWSDKGNGEGTPINETDQLYIRNAAKTSGFLDYKALLETYFLQIKDDRVNIFKLLLVFFGQMKHAKTGRTLQEDWDALNWLLPKRHTKNIQSRLSDHRQSFNENLYSLIAGFQSKINYRAASRGVLTGLHKRELLNMKLLVLIGTPLVRHIVSNLGFSPMVSNGRNRVPIRPKLATPQLLFDRGDALKDFPCGQAFNHPCNFRRAVHGNRLNQEMDMITVGSNFKKPDFVAISHGQAHVPNHGIDRRGHHCPSVFCGTDKVIHQNRDIVYFVEWFAHSCIVPDVRSESATPSLVSPPRRGNKPAFLPAASYGVSTGRST